MIKQAMFNRMVSVKKYVLTQLRKWNNDKTIPEEAAIKTGIFIFNETSDSFRTGITVKVDNKLKILYYELPDDKCTCSLKTDTRE